MTFVAASSSRIQLERLTRLLVSEFPGSTIYQHNDLLRIPHDVLNHRINAVFLEAEVGKTDSLNLMLMLRRQKPELPVFIISENYDLREAAAEAGANGFFVLPDCERQLLDAIRSV